MGKSFVKRDETLHTQSCDEAHLNTKTAYMSSYIFTKEEETNHVFPFYIFHVMSLVSHVFAEQKILL